MRKGRQDIMSDNAQEIQNTRIQGKETGSHASEIHEALEPESDISALFGRIQHIFARFGIKAKISNKESGFDEQSKDLLINKDALERNYSKIAAFVAVLMGPITAFGQSVGSLDQGHLFINRGVIAILIGILGVSMMGIKKITEKMKKPEFEKNLSEKFKKMKSAKDEDEKEKIKKDIVISFMGDLPDDMDKGAKDLTIDDKKDFEKAMQIKMTNGKFIDEIFSSIAEAFSSIQSGIGEDKNMEEIDKIKEAGSASLDKLLKRVEDMLNKLAKEYDESIKSAAAKKSNMYEKQLAFESKKLGYVQSYIKNTRKNFLVYMQTMKNMAIQHMDIKSLHGGDLIVKELENLQDKLKRLIDQQQDLDPEIFKKQLEDIDAEWKSKIDDAEKAGIITNEDEKETLISSETVTLDNKGVFTYPEAISYTINGVQRKIPLFEGAGVQLRITPNKEIRMNFLYKGKIVETETLEIKNDDLSIQASGEKLSEYIIKKGGEMEQGGKIDESEDKLPEGAEMTLNELEATATEVLKEINTGTYKVIGKNVILDHDAIAMQQIQIQKEYFDGGEHACMRFKLSDNYRKNAIQLLGKYDDIPKSEMSYNFENASGTKKYVNCPVIRFNIMAGGSAIPVIVSKDTDSASMYGEVKILLKKGVAYKPGTIKKAFLQVAKRLGIQKHIQPADKDAKQDLHSMLEKMRNEKQQFNGSEESVNEEYDTMNFEKSEKYIEDLRKSGLSSVYVQVGNNLADMIKTNALFSTFTRRSKGIFTDGMSSQTDFNNGGGLSAFLRMHTKNSQKNLNRYTPLEHKPALVFSPNIFKRLDCYCYPNDQFGSLNPDTFKNRVGPKKLTELMNASYISNNEIMFHNSVALDKYLRYIVCKNPEGMKKELAAQGISHIGNTPIEKMIISESEFQKIDFIP